jgi:hypothetical protein
MHRTNIAGTWLTTCQARGLWAAVSLPHKSAFPLCGTSYLVRLAI